MGRHERIERLRPDVHRDRQAVLKARALDVRVLLDEVELVLQPHLDDVETLQRKPQQVAQPGQHHHKQQEDALQGNFPLP
ncbi:MAG: hypothetical protein A3H96_16840 [Acidobacteria bacterium RIFCSPLOWO2_02_FULL_67_36]|nr:MAG: hypothetical protein A3H96_16840 [Acidobacteria bacterium RIFCSPLOWO2_02_FULL_67_36]OFW21508.1 MAG: hypothetical protein A3G21_00125 [Acidobacteria bacterium RIFCSPLOWO2_12_FULL_66_21]